MPRAEAFGLIDVVVLALVMALGAWLDLHPGWLGPPDAARLEASLLRVLDWQQRHVGLFGQRLTGRLRFRAFQHAA